jgi:diacylglycerol kinase family enzyme
VRQIAPLFEHHGRCKASLHVADSHAEAREICRDIVGKGSRRIISAGGSGTINSVLEGCIDSGVQLAKIELGFLRKGSASLATVEMALARGAGNASTSVRFYFKVVQVSREAVYE